MPYRLKAALCFTVLILLYMLSIQSPALSQQEEEDDLLLFLPAILSGKASKDNDGDGFSRRQGDCNDKDATMYPGAMEICGDFIDQDCNGSDLSCQGVDNDGDGYTENQGDCNDSIASIHPGAMEICGDFIDQDCNGKDQVCTATISVYMDAAHTLEFSLFEADEGVIDRELAVSGMLYSSYHSTRYRANAKNHIKHFVDISVQNVLQVASSQTIDRNAVIELFEHHRQLDVSYFDSYSRSHGGTFFPGLVDQCINEITEFINLTYTMGESQIP